MGNNIKILAIDTSCDETAAAVTEKNRVLSNIIWSQASMHAKWGGVYPSLAKRAHQERIDWVINKALGTSHQSLVTDVDAIAVTVGPGLAIALEVGINYAKELSKKYNKPLITVNHVEGHLLSPLTSSNTKDQRLKTNVFPSLAFVASGSTTQLILVKKIGDYKILATTVDDALGEALDKAARMLGLGYPGGAVLEKMARLAAKRARDGSPNSYPLPIPMMGKEDRLQFSYSGLKTAMYKLVESQKPLNSDEIENLSETFQDRAFQHAEKLIKKILNKYSIRELYFGGGVSANINLRKRIRKICKQNNIKLRLPYSKKLCTDNAVMIGVAAFYKFKRNIFLKPEQTVLVERFPRAKVDEKFPWE